MSPKESCNISEHLGTNASPKYSKANSHVDSLVTTSSVHLHGCKTAVDLFSVSEP